MSASPRWRRQYRRIADVLQQRVEHLERDRQDSHTRSHGTYIRDGQCYVCALVAAAPPLTPEMRSRLAALLWPTDPKGKR